MFPQERLEGSLFCSRGVASVCHGEPRFVQELVWLFWAGQGIGYQGTPLSERVPRNFPHGLRTVGGGLLEYKHGASPRKFVSANLLSVFRS